MAGVLPGRGYRLAADEVDAGAAGGAASGGGAAPPGGPAHAGGDRPAAGRQPGRGDAVEGAAGAEWGAGAAAARPAGAAVAPAAAPVGAAAAPPPAGRRLPRVPTASRMLRWPLEPFPQTPDAARRDPPAFAHLFPTSARAFPHRTLGTRPRRPRDAAQGLDRTRTLAPLRPVPEARGAEPEAQESSLTAPSRSTSASPPRCGVAPHVTWWMKGQTGWSETPSAQAHPQDGGGSAWNWSTIPVRCSPISTWVSRTPTVPSGST
jgi:hypothetical protein